MTIFADDLEKTADVYRALGLHFVGEKHGDGPHHLAHVKDGFVFEIYERKQTKCNGMMLGFEVVGLAKVKLDVLKTTATIIKDIACVDGSERMIISDPEGRQVYIQESV
jgi:hypothetical protein